MQPPDTPGAWTRPHHTIRHGFLACKRLARHDAHHTLLNSSLETLTCDCWEGKGGATPEARTLQERTEASKTNAKKMQKKFKKKAKKCKKNAKKCKIQEATPPCLATPPEKAQNAKNTVFFAFFLHFFAFFCIFFAFFLHFFCFFFAFFGLASLHPGTAPRSPKNAQVCNFFAFLLGLFTLCC